MPSEYIVRVRFPGRPRLSRVTEKVIEQAKVHEQRFKRRISKRHVRKRDVQPARELEHHPHLVPEMAARVAVERALTWLPGRLHITLTAQPSGSGVVLKTVVGASPRGFESLPRR